MGRMDLYKRVGRANCGSMPKADVGYWHFSDMLMFERHVR